MLQNDEYIGEDAAGFAGSCKGTVSLKLRFFASSMHFGHPCFPPKWHNYTNRKGNKPGSFRINSLQVKGSWLWDMILHSCIISAHTGEAAIIGSQLQK